MGRARDERSNHVHQEEQLEPALRLVHEILAQRVQHIRPVEQSPDLLRAEPVRDVVILEDVLQRPAAVVLADHVLRHPLFALRPRAEERERALDRIDETQGQSIV